MTKKEIKKGNQAIEQFMLNEKEEIAVHTKYHCSWNSFIPVLHKINTIRRDLYEDYYNDSQKKITELFYNNSSICEILMDLEELSLIGTSLDVAYNKAVLFIQWYNTAIKYVNGKH